MHKTFFQKWCDQLWLYAVYAIGLAVLNVTLYHWGAWDTPTTLIALLAVLIPLHVFEENQFPAGFHYQMNLIRGSDAPNVYPMNQVTDMFTNLLAELLVVVLLVLSLHGRPSNGMVLFVAFFGIGETVAHTLFGTLCYHRLKGKGKRTIYGPGSITAYCTLLELSVCSIKWLVGQRIVAADILVAAGILLFIVVFLILLPLSINGKVRSPRYAFPSSGYFTKYE